MISLESPPLREVQERKEDDIYESGTLTPEAVSMVEIRGADAVAEAKKAEDASCTALLIPRPPSRTGKEACNHWTSSKATLRTADRFSRKNASNLDNDGGL